MRAKGFQENIMFTPQCSDIDITWKAIDVGHMSLSSIDFNRVGVLVGEISHQIHGRFKII